RTCAQSSSYARREDHSCNVVTTLFPASSPLGFLTCISAMLSGTRIVWPPKTAGGAATLQRMGVDYVFGSPAQVDALCRGDAPKSRIRTLRVGGSIITLPSMRHWFRHFERMILIYAAAEIGVAGSLTLKEIGDLTEIAYALEPGTSAEIVNEDDEPQPHTVPGIVRLRTPTMSTGYIDQPEATGEAFRSGWFYPGDIG